MPPKKDKVKKPPAPRPIEYRYTPKLYFPLPVPTQSHNAGARAADPAAAAGPPASKEKERADRQNAVRFLQDTFKGRVDPALVQSILEDSGWREDLATETLIKIAEESSASELQHQYGLGSDPGAASYWNEILGLDRVCERSSDDLDERTLWLAAGLTQPTAPQLSSSASPSLRSLACQEGAIGSSAADSAFVERTLLQAASRLELQNRVLAHPDYDTRCRQASSPCHYALPMLQQQTSKSADDDELYNDLDCRLRLSAGTTPRDRLADSGEGAAGSFKNILASDESCEPSEPNALSWRSSAGSSLQGGAELSQLAPAMQRSPPLKSALTALPLSPPPPQQSVKSSAWLDVHYIQLEQGDIVLEKGTFIEQRSDAAVVCCPPPPGDAGSRGPVACSQLTSMGTSTVGGTTESAAVQSNPTDAQEPRIPFDLGLGSCNGSTTSGNCCGVSSSSSNGDSCSARCSESESRDDSGIDISRVEGKPSSSLCAIAQLGGAGLPICTSTTANLLPSREPLAVDSSASVGPAKDGDSSASSLGSSSLDIVSVTASATAAAAAAAPPTAAAAVATACALASTPAVNAGLLQTALPSAQNQQQQFRPAAQAAPVKLMAATAASTSSSSPSIYSLGASAAYMTDRHVQLSPPAKSWSSLASACAQSPSTAWSAPLDHNRSGLSTQPPCHDRAGRSGTGVSAESCLKKLVADIRQSSSRGKKILVLLRGCPGSGKSYLARHLKGEKGVVLSTDDFFMINGRYEYDYSRIGEAHDWNRKRAERALKDGVTPVIIDNTNTMIWEMGPYGSLALTYHYRLEICEPATEWKFDANELYRANSHGVPLDVIQAMIERYEHNVKPLDVINFARRSHPPARPPQLPVAARETVDTASSSSKPTEQLLTAAAQGPLQSSPRATDRFTSGPHSSDPAAQAASDDSTASPAVTAATGQGRPLAVSRNKMTSQTIRRNCLTPDVEKLRNKDFGHASPTSPDTDSTLLLSPVSEPSPSAQSLPNAPALSIAPPSATNDAATAPTAETAVTKSLPAHVLDNGAHSGGGNGRRNMHTSVGLQSECESSATVPGVLDVRPQLPGDRPALCAQSLPPETADRLPEPVSADVRSTTVQCCAIALDNAAAVSHRQPHNDEPAEQRRTADDVQVGSESCREELSLLATAVPAAPEPAASRQQTPAAAASSPASQLHRRLAANLGSPANQPPRPAACAAALSSSADDVAQPASMAATASPLAASSYAATADVANRSMYDSNDDARHRMAAFTMVEPGDFSLVAGLLSTGSLVGNSGKLATKCTADGWRVVVAAADAHRRPSGGRTAAFTGGTQEAGAARRSFAYSAAVSFDKSTMTDDDEVAADAGGEELLSSLFPQVSIENLRDVLNVCKGSVSWATNTLLDSGCDYADFSAVPSPKVPSVQSVPPAAGRAAAAATAQRVVAESTEKRHLSRPHRGNKRPTYRKLAPQSWASFYSPPRGASSGSVHLCYSGACTHPEHRSLAAAAEAAAAAAGSAFSDSDAFVTLTLTSESILRLTELFGSLGSEAAGVEELELLCGAGAFDVQLPLGLAQQLHSAIKRAAEGVRQWKSAVPGDAAHLGRSWSASQLAADWSHSAQGTGPADGLVHCLPDTAGDEELARRLQREENSGGMVLPPPLCEIMDAQLAEQVEQEQQQAKSAFGGQYQMLTMAERLRRQKLYDAYPTQASSYLDSVFDSCGRNLQRAIEALGNAAAVSAAIEQGAALISSTSEDVDDEWEDVPDEPVVQGRGRSSLAAPDQLYLHFRAQASHHLALRKECTRKAIAARSSGRTAIGPVVTWYMQQARNHAAQARRCNEVAAQRIFEARNPPPAERDREKESAGASSSERLQQLPLPLVMDLHGLHASEAVSRVRSAIESVRAEFERQPDRRLRRLTLITGKGTNSRSGIPRVKQAVMTFLQQKNVAFSEMNEGVLKVNPYRLPDAAPT